MKQLCLYICCSFILFLSSISIAAATPIHDNKCGGAFTFDGTGFEYGDGHFFGKPEFDCFPGESEIWKYDFGNAVFAFEINKNFREFEPQNQRGNVEEDWKVSNSVPGTLLLLGTGLIGLAAFRRKRVGRL